MASTIIQKWSNAFSDISYTAKSKRFAGVATGVYGCILIPRFAFISDVWLMITTAFTGNATIEIGWTGNKETETLAGFISNDIADPTVTGLKRAKKDTLVSFEGKYFDAGSGGILANVTKGTGTTGVFYVFASYCLIQ